MAATLQVEGTLAPVADVVVDPVEGPQVIELDEDAAIPSADGRRFAITWTDDAGGGVTVRVDRAGLVALAGQAGAVLAEGTAS
jgi:hypothetical protein